MRLRITLASTTLYRPVEIAVALPYGFGATGPPYRAVWALHSAMGGGDFFFDSLDAAGIVEKEHLAVIAPSMGNGYFINSSFERQADFLQELQETMCEIFPLSPRREDNASVGVSMGGFGAVRWALDSGVFGGAAAISGMFDCRVPLDERMTNSRVQRALYATFNSVMRRFLLDDDGQVKFDADFDRLLRKAKVSSFPRLELYCGEQDYMSLPQNINLEKQCIRHGCPVRLHVSEGEHDQVYWRGAFQDAVTTLFSTAG
jgi:enterochelin esterase-like enzyme